MIHNHGWPVMLRFGVACLSIVLFACLLPAASSPVRTEDEELRADAQRLEKLSRVELHQEVSGIEAKGEEGLRRVLLTLPHIKDDLTATVLLRMVDRSLASGRPARPADPGELLESSLAANRWAVASNLLSRRPELLTDTSRASIIRACKSLWKATEKLHGNRPTAFPEVRDGPRLLEFKVVNSLIGVTAVGDQIEGHSAVSRSLVVGDRLSLFRPGGIADSIVLSSSDIDTGNIENSIVIASGNLNVLGSINRSVVISCGATRARGTIVDSCVGSWQGPGVSRDSVRKSTILTHAELRPVYTPEWERTLGVRMFTEGADVRVRGPVGWFTHVGLLPDDQVVAMNGRVVDDLSELQHRLVESALSGDRVYVTVRRGGRLSLIRV